MHTTRAEPAYDSRANRAKRPDAYREPVSAEPGTVAVYVLHVQPDGMDGFVLDVYGSRAQAAADRELLEDEETDVSIRGYRVDAPRCPTRGDR